jgi:hypothetical protein
MPSSCDAHTQRSGGCVRMRVREAMRCRRAACHEVRDFVHHAQVGAAARGVQAAGWVARERCEKEKQRGAKGSDQGPRSSLEAWQLRARLARPSRRSPGRSLQRRVSAVRVSTLQMQARCCNAPRCLPASPGGCTPSQSNCTAQRSAPSQRTRAATAQRSASASHASHQHAPAETQSRRCQ